MSISGAGWNPADDWQSACLRWSAGCDRPIANRPQDSILPHGERGSALLAVLWLSLALSAIAFSLASTVQGETERTATGVDGLRSYYLATGAIERAILYIQWGKVAPPSGDSPFYYPGRPVMRMSFPTGEVEVEVIPETAKYDI